MLITQDLNDFVAHDPPLQEVYQGTFPKDWFIDHVFYDKSPIFPKAYIFNTDNSQSPGTHWISVYRPEEGKVEFFDSYGRHPRHWGVDLMQMLAYMGWQSQQSQHRPLQCQYSTLCGVYCLYMLHSRVRGWSFQHIIDSFHGPPLLNDTFLLHWYHRQATKHPKDLIVHPWTRMLHQMSKPYCPL